MRTALTSKPLSLVLCGLAAAAVPALAQAQTNAQAMLTDPFNFSFGAFVLSNSIKASLDGSSVNNPDVDFDEAFGIGRDATRYRFGGQWRITPAHSLRLGYFNNSNKASRTLAQDVPWGDYVFKAGTGATAEFNSDTTSFMYEYTFMRRPEYALGANIGVHYSKIGLAVSGQATVTSSNGTVSNVVASSRSETVPAPLPVIGLHGEWAVAPNWYLSGDLQFFKIAVNDIDGRWTNLTLNATYMFSRHWGIGAGYNSFRNNVDVSTPTYNGSLKYGYNGFTMFLSGTF